MCGAVKAKDPLQDAQGRHTELAHLLGDHSRFHPNHGLSYYWP